MMSSNGDGTDDATEAGATTLICPHCGQGIEARLAEVAQEIPCPACAGVFVLPAIDGSTDVPPQEHPDDERERIAAERERELDGLRLRNLTLGKLAAIRGRTYALVGAFACAVTAVKCILKLLPILHEQGVTPPVVGFALIALAAVVAVVPLLFNAAELNRDCRTIVIPEPQTPPDFSTLSDGSQIAEQLKDIK
jgi:hypothetical protein